METLTKNEWAELVDLYIQWSDNRNYLPLEMERQIAGTILKHFDKYAISPTRLRKAANQRRKFKKYMQLL